MFPSSIKPGNTKFLQHDFLKNLPYADCTFEFVRMRLMLGFLTEKQLLHLISEIQRVLKPLGYVEILDVEYQIHRPGPICESVLNQQCKPTCKRTASSLLTIP
jgi:ubiquinone/menaquinone biosynthesis C-methylase UbiE